jgi:hypothetical protein
MNTTLLRLSIFCALYATMASAAGVFLPATYARETATWAAQGAGQDIVNLVLIVPAFVYATFRTRQGSAMARTAWRGLLLYLAYSYVLYAFFVHFSGVFLIYVGTLGFAVFALIVDMLNIDRRTTSQTFAEPVIRKSVSVFLVASAVLFAGSWLKEIAHAVVDGVMPASALAIGAAVNPVHVLDLALALPAMIVVGVLLWRGDEWGVFWAGPLLVFMVSMGLAIVGMSLVMQARGLADVEGLVVVMTAIVVVGGIMLRQFLVNTRMINLTG